MVKTTSIHNAEIAELFTQLADLLEIEGANPFRIRAYRNAARLISNFSGNISDLVANKEDLTQLPGIGDALAQKIQTIVKTGKLPALAEVQKRVPAGLSDLLKIEGLGPKRVKVLHKKLGIKNLNDLKKKLKQGKVSKLSGFGEKTQTMIQKALEHIQLIEIRHKLFEAEAVAKTLVEYLKKIPGVLNVEVAGSFRRRRETVGDLDILVATKKSAKVIIQFIKYDGVKEIISKGTTRSTVHLHSNLQVDLRVISQVSYGAALLYFTGSKAHNIELRKIAIKKQLKLNEYGLFKGTTRLSGKSEREVYRRLGLRYIEPELRENRGEIEAALKNKLPKLVTLEDICGDCHCHTNETDGIDTLEAMVNAAKKKGYKYIAITDHSKHLTVAHGLDKKRLFQQIKMIDRLNEKISGIRILKSIELDILEDGRLDLPNYVLKELDLTVCSIHYKFKLSKKKQTERILRAMDNPYFNIFAHPTGRLINRRDPYDIDFEAILQAAKERHCFLEVNAQPDRMDLNDVYCKMAKEHQVKVIISTDSHCIANLDYMRLGVSQARRGWLEPEDVINTLPLKKFLKLIKKN